MVFEDLWQNKPQNELPRHSDGDGDGDGYGGGGGDDSGSACVGVGFCGMNSSTFSSSMDAAAPVPPPLLPCDAGERLTPPLVLARLEEVEEDEEGGGAVAADQPSPEIARGTLEVRLLELPGRALLRTT